MKIKISDIKVGDNRREIDEANVLTIADSMKEVGLINPITVTADHTLIAGAHRLEACKLLNWSEIECNVVELDGLKAELAEIDENLIRHNLSHLDEGEQLLRKKEIYEMLYPETKKGVAQAIGMNRAVGNNVSEDSSVTSKKSFVDDSAEKMNLTPRRVQQKIQIARDLTPEVKEIVKENGIGLDPSLKLARIKEPEKQKEAAKRMVKKPTEPPKPKNEKAVLKEVVSHLKSEKTQISMSGSLFLQEYNAFAKDTIRSFEWYKQEMYTNLYPLLTKAELKEITALNTAMLKAVEKIIDIQKGF
ncbi:ParB/RepB/Spo0J family partition protein [Scatolibacter rhodanostii]|uniref:ParB/RepB/Spo0J family partition protein n=1 Tax=Scatolibacter rhodanostii TaxID=2014781 RepID=UPI000C073A2C|nr:ParB N-terminal domain-containing protein [Scatolibacter rhodanostii]